MREEGDLATDRETMMIQDGSHRYSGPVDHTGQPYSDISDDGDDAIQSAKSQSCVTETAVAGPSHLQTLADAVPSLRIIDDVMLSTPLDLDKLRRKQVDNPIEPVNGEVGHDSSIPTNSSQGGEETECLILISSNNAVTIVTYSLSKIYNCLHSFILHNCGL
ncbi:hypothetical protein QAD02_013477 [Eretmocerus hayati]|uniref:Uncharacterized protein n=2 Tax=Eretmocerus hayati TaxID=131215 RepID=A0ACC2N575_9HYME|nr:hypothetical protein QAD02_007545 [Eretmocerus hayati]KAJ8677690.1 hypothetical protein QAD02_013477 [Eretmocerus hayati]